MNILNISEDVLYNEILLRLGVRDILSLKLTCKSFNDLLDNNLNILFVKRIENSLNKVFDSKLIDFYKFLENNNVAISGSYITQCIINEYYQFSDIDIIINCSKKVGN